MVKNVKRPGRSTQGNILTALRTMSTANGPNMGSATPNRTVAPQAPSPMASAAPQSGLNPTAGPSTGEVSLPVSSLGGSIKVGDRISVTVTRVEGNLAFGRPVVAASLSSIVGSNLPTKIL